MPVVDCNSGEEMCCFFCRQCRAGLKKVIATDMIDAKQLYSDL